jgi:hypothetical protein
VLSDIAMRSGRGLLQIEWMNFVRDGPWTSEAIKVGSSKFEFNPPLAEAAWASMPATE